MVLGNFRYLLLHFLIGGVLLLQISACKTPKNFAYFRDIPDSVKNGLPPVAMAPFKEALIKVGDMLQISVLTNDPQQNTAVGTTNSTGLPLQSLASPSVSPNGQAASVFQVDKNGKVELPIIGSVIVAGLTTGEAKDALTQQAAKFYINPIVNLRFSSYTVTVLGEVTKPGVYTAPSEKVSVLDAIGMAGDLTIFGKRENVLLIRDSATHKQFTRFDLNSTTTLQSPYFYLQSGDVLYIEPNNSKIVATDAVRTRNFTIIASALTVLIVLFSRL